MRVSLIITVAAVLAAVPTSSRGAGALAIDSNQGTRHGFASGFSDQAEADEQALDYCGSGCSIVVQFDGLCAAFAADQTVRGTAVGRGFGADRAEAEATALRTCAAFAGGLGECMVRVWGCDPPQ